MPLTPESLAQAMGNTLPLSRYNQLYPAVNRALLAAECTTVDRTAMWMAQIGHESGGLQWMEELADGTAYEGRADLGNTQPGDGPRFKGHGPIQITGRHNHGRVSEWAFAHGLAPTATYFIDHPVELAGDEYGFVGVTWYWTAARPMNSFADNADITGATRAVNGGLNGLADRTNRWNRARKMGDAIVPSGSPPQPGGGAVGFTGDPLWLEDVLRPALGDRLKVMPGWEGSGVGGTMGRIWGTIFHHTGNAGATAQSIRDGREDLAGPLAQLHIAQDGTVTLVAVGPCNHAGSGSWVGLPTDNANEYTIGIECAYPKDVNNQRERWPDAQIISMRDTGAAITAHLEVDVSHNISHREWAQLGPAGYRQGKTDPWNLDMGWFRGEVAKDIAGAFEPKPDIPPLPPPEKVFPQGWADRELLEYVAVQLGPWLQLGQNDKSQNLTPVDFLAKYRPALDRVLKDMKA